MKPKRFLVFLSVLILFSLACSASNIISQIFGRGGDIESRIAVVENELTLDQGVDTCEPNWWSSDFWVIHIAPELAQSDARCWDFSPYQRCVQDRAQAGDCSGEAMEYCAPVYQAILEESTQRQVQLRDDSLYVRDDDNIFSIQFSLSGGSVEGFVKIDYRTEYGDGDYCEVTQEKYFSGTYDPGSCLLSGTVRITETHDENRNDICWGDPYEQTEDWSMIIKNGRLGPGGPYNQLVGETYYLPEYLK